MKESLHKKYEEEFTFDLPISLHGLYIYPIKLKDYVSFVLASNILAFEKNRIDPKYITMTYLDFLIDRFKQDKEGILQVLLYKCLSLSLRNENIGIKFGIDEQKKTYIDIDGVIINSKDFDDIKELILHQNLPNYRENNIRDEDLRRDLEEYDRIMNKGRKMESLEMQMLTVQLSTKIPLNDLYDITMRKFILLLELSDRKLHYIIYKTASMSGFVKFDKEIEHFLTKKEYSIKDKVTDVDSLYKKINSTQV